MAPVPKQLSREYASYLALPSVARGQRVGLLGGSFDPPHTGHVHISVEAIKRLQLDQLWWLVSPGNPLKEQGPWPLEKRLAQCIELAQHPRIRVTAFEARLGSPYTAETLAFLVRRFPTTNFTWLMGADNLANIHHWRNWRRIFEMVAIAVIDRPGMRYQAVAAQAAKVHRKDRLRDREASLLGRRKAPAWCLLTIPLSHESSTQIRQRHLNLTVSRP